MSAHHTYTVGRSQHAVVTLPSSNKIDTVSREHIQVESLGNGQYSILDLNSSNGTYIYDSGAWRRIQKDSVHSSTPLRLGSYATSIASIESLMSPAPAPAPQPAAAAASPPPTDGRRRIRRDPNTGEIIF